MGTTTTNWALPYPFSSDEVASGATNIKDLADAVSGALGDLGGHITTVESKGPTSGTNDLNLWTRTTLPSPGPGFLLCFAQITTTQTVAGDSFTLRWYDNTAASALASVLINPGSTASTNTTVVAWRVVGKSATGRDIRLQLTRSSGTGTASTGGTSTRNVAGIFYLPGTVTIV